MASRVHFKNEKLKKLAGKRWTVAGTEYQFADYKNRAVTGKPPWKGGGEGGAYPLLSRSGQTILYLKFFSHQTLQRKSRTQWLIAQRVGEWLLELRGAPRSWWDTRQVGRPQEIDFDIEGSVCPAVSGMTWAEVKTAIEQQRASPSIEVRKRCVKHLLRALAVLESAGFVHGDLSPNNVIVDFNGQRTQPALYLIDFDSFVCGAAGPELAQLDDSINAKHGTPGYYPPSLDQQPDPVPFSDRYARDMLLLELMCYSRRFPADDALSSWDAQAKLALEEIRKQTWLVGQLSHLRIPEVFVLPERKRPTSAELCRLIGISVPSRPKIRPRARPRTTQHRRVHPAGTLAVLVCVSVVLLAFVSNSGQRSRQLATRPPQDDPPVVPQKSKAHGEDPRRSDGTRNEARNKPGGLPGGSEETESSPELDTDSVDEPRLPTDAPPGPQLIASRLYGAQPLPVSDTVFSPDGHKLYSAHYDPNAPFSPIRVWNTADGNLIDEFHLSPRSRTQFSPDAASAVIGNPYEPQAAKYQFVSLETGKAFSGLLPDPYDSWHFWLHAFAGDGESIVGVLADTKSPHDVSGVCLWASGTAKPIALLTSDRYGGAIECAAVALDESVVVFSLSSRSRAENTDTHAAENDWPLYLWKVGSDVLLRLSGHTDRVTAIVISDDAEEALTAGDDGRVLLWDLLAASVVREIGRHRYGNGTPAPAKSVLYLAKRNLVASGGADRFVRLWDIDTGREVARSQCGLGAVVTLAATADGRMLAFGSYADSYRGNYRKGELRSLIVPTLGMSNDTP